MTPPADPYLDLLKCALCASLYDESAWRIVEGPMRTTLSKSRPLDYAAALAKRAVLRFLKKRSLALIRRMPYRPELRDQGFDWPCFGYTMIGRKRLDNIHACAEQVLAEGIPGDFMETGVWRGGSTILMRAILKHHGVTNRIVWCADSFQGLPVPGEIDRSIDKLSDFSDREYLAVSQEQVAKNFARFGLLDSQVRFLKGWFKDTLPSAPVRQLAILRLDGDLYESTMQALTWMYPKLSRGGFLIIDDYNSWAGCKQAVEDYRKAKCISADMHAIDAHACYWRVPML